ncbi:MAG TPA: RluA family pseudouridine synthase [Blastocatellia bacterium]|nr:RluA family pseudouridine synthase [Blastocatellia bacterium]
MHEGQTIRAVRSFQASDADGGQRLDEFLAARVGDLSRMRIANLIAAGGSTVNGEVARAGLRVTAGDLVVLAVDAGAPTAMSPDDIPLEILFEDEQLIVLVKPTGLLVHPTLSVKRGTLANALAHHLNEGFGFRASGSGFEDPEPHEPGTLNSELLVRPGLVHRLDRATSGLMVVAKTQRALSVLSRHFRKRLVEKRYLALVHGNVSEDQGTITAPIGRDTNRRPRWWVMESGKPAETRFQVRERLKRATLLDLQPVTGRTNQLRIHCAYYRHPIIGDELYETVVSGQWSVVRESGPRSEEASTDHWTLTTDHCSSRLCLHACRLAFHHPDNGEWMVFASPPPAEFISCLEAVRSER